MAWPKFGPLGWYKWGSAPHTSFPLSFLQHPFFPLSLLFPFFAFSFHHTSWLSLMFCNRVTMRLAGTRPPPPQFDIAGSLRPLSGLRSISQEPKQPSKPSKQSQSTSQFTQLTIKFYVDFCLPPFFSSLFLLLFSFYFLFFPPSPLLSARPAFFFLFISWLQSSGTFFLWLRKGFGNPLKVFSFLNPLQSYSLLTQLIGCLWTGDGNESGHSQTWDGDQSWCSKSWTLEENQSRSSWMWDVNKIGLSNGEGCGNFIEWQILAFLATSIACCTASPT